MIFVIKFVILSSCSNVQMRTMAYRAIFSLLFACASAGAVAQNVADGQSIFQSVCSACHISPPVSFDPSAAAANNPTLIKEAIAGTAPLGVGNMAFLRGMFSDAQLADIAAYIGSVLAAPAPPTPPATPTPQFDYSDLWYNANESGWGLNLVQHASHTVFGVIYTYESPNRPVWYVMPQGLWTANNVLAGSLYEVSATGANSTAFKQGPVTQVGAATLTFSDQNTATFVYTVNGAQVSKTIQRQPY
jgi:mono/diheme cytochrome c family protein